MKVSYDNDNVYIKCDNNLPSSDGECCGGEYNCDFNDGCEEFIMDEKREMNKFRHPEALIDHEIQHMTEMNVRRPLARVENYVSCKELDYRSQCLMYLAYYRKGLL